MNILFRVAGIIALLTTITTLISRAWSAAPSVIHFIASNAPFFYGCAVGIGIASFTKNLWAIIIVIALVFLGLKWLGL